MSLNNPQKTDMVKACSACGREFAADVSVCPDCGVLLAPIAGEDLVGTVLDNKYEILEKIGVGGMGAVYKARHQLMHRMVAIKVVLAQLSANSLTLKRFTQEARATSQLNHPNILTVFDFGMSPAGQPYLVMDFLEGQNFARVLEEERNLPLARSLGIFMQICAALGHAHQKGIIHRDLKPSNIMLVELDGQPDFVKVLDFGIAKVLSTVESENDNLTRTGEIFGSPLYMSPEQFRGKALDPRSDVYALGCVMYRTLTGTCPVTGKDVLECMYKHVNEAVPPFDRVAPELELPERLEQIVMKALAKDPDDRYASMTDLRLDLEALAEELQLGAIAPVHLRSGSYASADSGSVISSGSRFPEGQSSGSHSASPQGQAATSGSQPRIVPLPAVPEAGRPHLVAKEPAPNEVETPVWSEDIDHTVGSMSLQDADAARAQSASPDSVSIAPVGMMHTGSSISLTGSALLGATGPHLASGEEDTAALKAQPQLMPPPPKQPLLARLDARIKGAIVALIALLAVAGAWFAVSPTMKQRTTAAPGTYEFFTNKGLEAYSAGNYSEAEKFLRQAHELARKFPADDKRKIESLINLGEACVATVNYKDAKTYLLLAASELSKEHHEKTPQYARIQHDLGELIIAQDDYDAAEPYFQKAYELRMTFTGRDRADAADSLQGLATILLERGKYAEAAAKLEQAKSLIAGNLGENEREYAQILSDLARAYSLMAGKANPRDRQVLYAKATDLYKQAMDIGEKSFGPDHPQFGKIVLAYATLCYLQKDFLNAESRFNQAMRIASKASGEKSMAVAEIQASLAFLYITQKRYGEADALLTQAIPIAINKLGPTDDVVRRWQTYKRLAEKSRRR
ncbi:MAG TPA: serine/threonine-protein kinase [Candidatus Obscuribacterales bacterium]